MTSTTAVARFLVERVAAQLTDWQQARRSGGGTAPGPRVARVVGLPGALTVAGLVTVFQTSTTDAHRGRVFGAITALKAAAMRSRAGSPQSTLLCLLIRITGRCV